MMRCRPTRALGAAVVLGLLGSLVPSVGAGAASTPSPACAGSDPQVREGGPDDGGASGVTRLRFTFVDRSRPTRPDHADAADADGPCRVIRTAVRIPSDAAGPVPLILVVHGRDGDPDRLAPLLDRWVAAGYAVAAPTFLRTQKGDDGKPTGAAVRRQSADARFVLDQLLGLDQDPAGVLHGVFDADRIGAAGMSLGGMTVYGLIANTCCRDHRIRAAVLLAAVRRPFPHGTYTHDTVPTMLIQGDRDKGYHNSVRAYPELAPPKWFVTLHGATHSPPFEAPRGPEARIVDDTTTAFWDLSLGGDPTAAHEIVEEVRSSGGMASLRRST